MYAVPVVLSNPIGNTHAAERRSLARHRMRDHKKQGAGAQGIPGHKTHIQALLLIRQQAGRPA